MKNVPSLIAALSCLSLASCGTSAVYRDVGRAPSIEHKPTVDLARRVPRHCPDCGGRFPPPKRWQ